MSSTLWSMLGLVLVVPLAVGVPMWLEYRSVAVHTQDRVIDVPRGAVANHAGASWRLVWAGPGPAGLQPPRDTAVVYAVLEITPKDAKSAKKLWGECSFTASDGRGRRWASNSQFADYDRLRGVGTGCRTSSFAPLPPGRPHKVAITYLVPVDAVESLRPEVRASRPGKRQGPKQYLRFER